MADHLAASEQDTWM